MSASDIPTEPPPPPARKPTYPDEEDERYAIGEAWHVMMDARRDGDIAAGPMTGLLFAALACVYEGAEGDPPVMGVLMAIRDTVRAWSHTRSGSTLFASVGYADLALLVRRVDVAMALVKSDAIRAGEP
jgi:hypothetical protein